MANVPALSALFKPTIEVIVRARSKRDTQFVRAREEIDAVGLDEARREAILRLSLSELRDSLQQEKFCALEVLCAYAHRALEVQAISNCITAFFTEAFDEARRLDERYSPCTDELEKKPPLFGVPFSVKGNFFVGGYDAPSGFIQYLDDPQSTTNSFVAHLRQLGGVPFVHTNVPQGLLSYLCTNPIYGTTTHPARAERTPGGTCGGEAALIAAGGAPFGMGADLGGSMRVPASFCGLVTLKCCAERMQRANARGGMAGAWGVACGYGFITRRVEDQRLLLEHFYGSEAYAKLAPPLLPLPFNHEIAMSEAKMRIGYFLDDGFLSATSGCRRVVAETVAKLRDRGHELVPFSLPDPETAALFVYKALMPDGGAYYRARFAKEAVIDPCLKPFVDWIHGETLPMKELGSPQARIFNTASRIKDAAEVTELQGQIDAHTARFHSTWRDAGLDALICPAFALPAVGHSYPHRLPHCRFTPAIWNMLNLPAGVVPAGEWSEGDEAALHDESAWSGGENDVLKLMREAATGSVGLPLAVQVVALPYHEEVALSVMAEVERVNKC